MRIQETNYGREIWFGLVDTVSEKSLLVNDGCTSAVIKMGTHKTSELYKKYEDFLKINKDTATALLVANIIKRRTPYAVFYVDEFRNLLKDLNITKFNKYKFVFIRDGRFILCYKLDNVKVIYEYINSLNDDITRYNSVLDILTANTSESLIFNESVMEIFYRGEWNLKNDFVEKMKSDKGTLTISDYGLDIEDIYYNTEDIEDFYLNLCSEILLSA